VGQLGLRLPAALALAVLRHLHLGPPQRRHDDVDLHPPAVSSDLRELVRPRPGSDPHPRADGLVAFVPGLGEAR